MGEESQKIKISSCKINEFWRCKVQYGDNSVDLKVAKRVGLKITQQKKKKL